MHLSSRASIQTLHRKPLPSPTSVFRAIAQCSWFVANANLQLVVAFPIVTTTPGLVGSAWYGAARRDAMALGGSCLSGRRRLTTRLTTRLANADTASTPTPPFLHFFCLHTTGAFSSFGRSGARATCRCWRRRFWSPLPRSR